MSISNSLFLKLTFGNLVELDYEVLNQVCDFLSKNKNQYQRKPMDWRNTHYWPDDSEGVYVVSQFFAIGNAINFRYWWRGNRGAYGYCKGVKGKSSERGAYYMWRALRLCQKAAVIPILDSKKLSKISISEMKHIFRDDKGHDLMPALKERQRNWRDLGHKLLEYWDGQFYNLVKTAQNSLFDFVRYSRQFRAFDDPLCKMVMVNSIMHQGRGIVKFKTPIFPGIDYQLLKQQMRMGIVVPKGRLMKKLISQEILTHNEARELRNAGLHSFLHIMERTGIPGDVIDNIWWTNKRICRDQQPQCEGCLFSNICRRKQEYGIPREITRYY